MRRLLLIVLLLIGAVVGWWIVYEVSRSCGGPPTDNTSHVAGAPLDSLNGVVVYYNAGMSAVHGRNTVDGYNVGLKYQCVEFVKRYYLEHYHHRMPNSYGHAKDLFDPALADSTFNTARGLVQFSNNSSTMPKEGDLLVIDGSRVNSYGHVAIVSKVADGEVEVIQQNTGSPRDTYDLDLIDGRWRIDNKRVLGWLRMP
ncbi:MAG: CHAP domain-containing protein [Flavobacteriales bacterium]|nr:CHAP domain-containing protein [Flavobacteriales bacterium]